MSNRVYAKKPGSDADTSKVDEIIAAIRSDDIPLLKNLMDQNKHVVNTKGSKGHSPLSSALAASSIQSLETILEFKEVKFDPECGLTLSYFARDGQKEIVKLFLRRDDIDVNCLDYSDVCAHAGCAALHYAINAGYNEIVKMLLADPRTNVNLQTLAGATPLYCAAENDNERIISMLLKHDIDVNIKEKDGLTALHEAVINDNARIVRLLLACKDIDVNVKAEAHDDATPFLIAAQNGYMKIVKLFLEREDVDVNAADCQFGQSPLMMACAQNHIDIVKLLLSRKGEGMTLLNVNQKTTPYHGYTAFYTACHFGRTEIVKLFLDCEVFDVDYDLADDKGVTPLQIAMSNIHSGVTRLLLEREMKRRAVEEFIVKPQKKEARREKKEVELRDLEKSLSALDVE